MAVSASNVNRKICTRRKVKILILIKTYTLFRSALQTSISSSTGERRPPSPLEKADLASANNSYSYIVARRFLSLPVNKSLNCNTLIILYHNMQICKNNFLMYCSWFLMILCIFITSAVIFSLSFLILFLFLIFLIYLKVCQFYLSFQKINTSFKKKQLFLLFCCFSGYSKNIFQHIKGHI